MTTHEKEVQAALKAFQERVANLCEERAEYFDRAPGHRDWKDAARSYRATAQEIRNLRLSAQALFNGGR